MKHSPLTFISNRSQAQALTIGKSASSATPPANALATETGAPFEFELYQLAQAALDERAGPSPGRS